MSGNGVTRTTGAMKPMVRIGLVSLIVAAPALATTSLFEGTVRDFRGSPVADVDLDWFDPATGRQLDPRADSTEGDNTDAFGRYRCSVVPGVYDVRYAAPLVRPDLAAVLIPGVDLTVGVTLDVTLPSGSRLTGVVTGPDGSPVQAVDLDLVDVTTGIKAPTVNDDTGTDGRYSVTVVPGVYDVLFEPALGSGVASYRAERVDLSTEAVLNVQLERAFLVAGRVIDGGGAGIDSVDLDVNDSATGARVLTPGDLTYPDGSFILQLPAGQFDVFAFPPAGAAFAPAALRDITIVDVGADLPPIVMTPGVEVRLTLVGPTGLPVPGADIDFYLPASGDRQPDNAPVTGADGMSVTRVETHLYDVHVTPTGSPVPPAWFRGLDISSDTTLTLAYPLETPERVLAATVVRDPEGGAVAGVHVAATPLDSGEAWEVISAADGTLQAWVFPGHYRLELDPPAGSSLIGATLDSVLVPDELPPVITLARTPAPPAFYFRIDPNPSLGGATLAFEVPADVPHATVVVFDLAGRFIARLHDGPIAAGPREFTWDGRREDGREAPAGIYFARYQDGARTLVKKLVRAG